MKEHFNEDDKSTRNHKFWVTKNGNWESKPATKAELKKARNDLMKGLKNKKYELMVIGRSCWVCNGAHAHLIKMPAMNCFVCGRIYHKGIDVMDYS